MDIPSTIHIAAQGYERNSQPSTPKRRDEIGDVCYALMGRYSSHEAFNFEAAFKQFGVECIEHEGIIIPLSAYTPEKRLIITHPYGSEELQRRILMHQFGHFVLGEPYQHSEADLRTFTEKMMGHLSMTRRMEWGIEYGAHLAIQHREELTAFRRNRREYDKQLVTTILDGNKHNP